MDLARFNTTMRTWKPMRILSLSIIYIPWLFNSELTSTLLLWLSPNFNCCYENSKALRLGISSTLYSRSSDTTLFLLSIQLYPPLISCNYHIYYWTKWNPVIVFRIVPTTYLYDTTMIRWLIRFLLFIY